MALTQFTIAKLQPLLTKLSGCHYSTAKSQIKKSVFISQSNDIFTNLALEDWLYRNYDFSNHHIMMLSYNDPCVVIGKHQNPWLETNISNLPNIIEKGVKLARRCSSGGTVYYDKGNLNITFFTTKDKWNFKHNMQLIARAIFRRYGININTSPTQDLAIRNSKISNNGSRFGHCNAYHHCSLLVNVNKVDLFEALYKEEDEIKTMATKSTKSKLLNLSEIEPKITVNGLLSAIGWEYLRTPINSFKDGGKLLANRQNGFQMVNPTEQWFPGLTQIHDTFKDWEWCYGKTPKFSVSKSFSIPAQFLNCLNAVNENLKVTVTVEKGRINDVTLYVPPGLSSTGYTGEAKVITNLKGHKFTEEALNSLEWSLSRNEYGLVDDKDKFVTECVRQVMTSV